MENLKRLAKKILEKPGIFHKDLKPKKGDMKSLKKYLESVGFRLLTTYHHTQGGWRRITEGMRSSMRSQGIKTRGVQGFNVGAENHDKRQYHIIKK